MSRFALALCALAVAMTPRVALPTISRDFQRPDAYGHAINAVLGDLSFLSQFGTPPLPGTDADLRVRTHLEFVHGLLSQRDVSAFPTHLREARRENLARLRDYIDAGRFPRNHLFANENRPCFIDQEGRICAVGYLVEQSAGRDVAERINAEFRSEFLWRMHLPELDGWIATSGLSLLELSMIQPQYDPKFYVTISQDSPASPATVKLKGYVRDEGCCYGVGYVAIDFGDGALWVSPQVNAYSVAVDVEHTYTQPGVYMITAKAPAAGSTNLVGTKIWIVAVDEPMLLLIPVEMQGGPPYGVYLTTTDEIRLDCLASATVQWNHPRYLPGPAGWYFEGGRYRTPVYYYDSIGSRTVLVANTYEASCGAVNQAGSVVVNVTGTVTPTETATWGRVKALYR